MQENTHYANLYVPVSVAALLKERPSLVSAAVQAFYYRDPAELTVGLLNLVLTLWLPCSCLNGIGNRIQKFMYIQETATHA